MTFTTQRLVNSRLLVSGTDIVGSVGQCTLDTTQWDDLTARTQFRDAEADFDAAVDEFFAPLEAALDKLHSVGKVDPDPATYIVLQEEVAGTPSQPGQLVKLTPDSVIIRMLEQGDDSRLLWVDGRLEVTERRVSAPVLDVNDTPQGVITPDQIPE